MNLKRSIQGLCKKLPMSRQSYYKGRTERCRQEVDADFIEQQVRAERAVQPRLGGKKLYYVLQPKLAAAGVQIGRDRFFEGLQEKGLLLDPLPKAPRTTNSRRSLPIFRNQLKEMKRSGPNQAWVRDRTYLRTDEGFLYWSLIPAAWSRKIVGDSVGDTLETEGGLKALEKALKGRDEGATPRHHSDRGRQSCSPLYTDELRKYGFGISLTEEMHGYENAQAERVHGILKQEVGLGGCFRSKPPAKEAVAQAVELYNTRRPHGALKYKTPDEVHREFGSAA